jgi:hypothetical protein
MEEGFLVLDDLDGDLALLHLVVGLHHLPEGALPDQRVYLVPGNKELESIRVYLGTDPDPDPIRIQGFDDQKIKKI